MHQEYISKETHFSIYLRNPRMHRAQSQLGIWRGKKKQQLRRDMQYIQKKKTPREGKKRKSIKSARHANSHSYKYGTATVNKENAKVGRPVWTKDFKIG